MIQPFVPFHPRAVLARTRARFPAGVRTRTLIRIADTLLCVHRPAKRQWADNGTG